MRASRLYEHYELPFVKCYKLCKAVANSLSVKQFIRNVRASKTIADERAVVQKESAAIRASFREESGDSNTRFAKGMLEYQTKGLKGLQEE